MQSNEEELGSSLDNIFKMRYHGASNIRGIRFQILYSVLRSFDLYTNNINFIRPEGIEDLDLIGLSLENEYIQVKTSINKWNWSKLKEIIPNFMEVLKKEPNSNFSLIIGAEVDGNVEKLINLDSLPSGEQKHISRKIRKMSKDLKLSFEEVNKLLQKLNIIQTDEKDILNQIRLLTADNFDLIGESVNFYILVLIAKFLEWAQDRKIITLSDLNEIKLNITESISKETEFQEKIKAYGQGLIGRINWSKDEKVSDFFEGKKTRPGHIVAGADFKREFWLDKINKAISTAKICIIKSSSGQGKSALLYRYAYGFWPEENIFILRLAENREQIELVRNYLKFRTSLGVPILLLIDDIGSHTRLSSLIIQECVSLGINVLATIRNEDWYRFLKEGTTKYEVIEPKLNFEEAKEIYKVFKLEGKVNQEINSPEHAYEKIDEPKLLLEYIYLITQGKMLKEKLRDQIREFTRLGEDQSKIEILRRSSLANTLGTPVRIKKLLDNIESRDDKQELLKSLLNEYIEIEGELIKGHHWVRSEHLTEILHEYYPGLAETGLKTFDAIQSEDISKFVSNALCKEGLNEKTFLNGIAEKDLNINYILYILEGIFEAGERKFFLINENIFDEGYDFMGSPAITFMHVEFCEFTDIDISLKKLGDSAGDKGQNFYKLKEIAERAKIVPRGLDLCKDFLIRINENIDPKQFNDNYKEVGILLDWFSLCELEMDVWPFVKDDLIHSNIFEKSINEFSCFAQGLYRYEKNTYCNWVSENQESIIGYLKFNLECIKLEINENILYMEFIPDDTDIYEQKMSRLRGLRSSIPFCKEYQSKGKWTLPFEFIPPEDDTIANMSKEKLPFESDINKNAVLGRILDEHYLPDSFYIFEQSWFILRENTLKFVKQFSRQLINLLLRKKYNFQEIYQNNDLMSILDNIVKYEVDLPPQASKEIQENFKLAKKWSGSFINFFNQLPEYIISGDIKIGKVVLLNFQDVFKYLKELKTVFRPIFDNYPIYFNFQFLNENEIKEYELLCDLLSLWILSPPMWLNNPSINPPNDIKRYIKVNKGEKRDLLLKRARDALEPLENEGINIILPKDIYFDPPLRYLSFAYSIEDFEILNDAFGMIIEKLTQIIDIADFFCIIPLYHRKSIYDGGYQISSNQIMDIVKGRVEDNIWALMPHKIDKKLLSHLEEFNFQNSPFLKLTGIITILTEIQMIIGWLNEIKVLKESQNYEIKLYNKYMATLNNKLSVLKENTLNIKKFLINEFNNGDNDPNSDIILSYITKIENSSLDNLSNELYIPFDNLIEIGTVIEQLISQN